MTKISFDTENQEVTVTRPIGKKGDGSITINREGGGSIEVNLGIASIGATSDYGGAISLGIAGQEVTWGREGGTIHIGIGGFAVDVEAKDCIVVETKSIFGQIVAQRSYPDPGCKLPEPRPKETAPVISGPPATVLEDGADLVYVVLDGTYDYYDLTYGSYLDTSYSKSVAKVKQIPEVVSEYSSEGLPFIVEEKLTFGRTFYANWDKSTVSRNAEATYEFREGITLGFSSTFQIRATNPSSAISTSYSETLSPPNASLGGSSVVRTTVLYGSQTNCKRWIADFENTRNSNSESIYYKRQVQYKFNVVQVIKLGKQQPPAQLLPTGNKPPMNDCCEQILDYLEDFRDAFAIVRMLKEGFPVSNTFMAPNCDPASTTKAKNYYELLQCIVRMLAHGLIFEPKVKIKDADAAKAGDQEFQANYINATGWASAMAEALLEVKDDGNVATNCDIRSGFASTQTMVGMADAIYKLEAILDVLGITLMPKVETVETPYNCMIAIGKGFGADNERKLDLNQDDATEALLPEFLQTKKNKIKTVAIHPRSRTIQEILESIESRLPIEGTGNG